MTPGLAPWASSCRPSRARIMIGYDPRLAPWASLCRPPRARIMIGHDPRARALGLLLLPLQGSHYDWPLPPGPRPGLTLVAPPRVASCPAMTQGTRPALSFGSALGLETSADVSPGREPWGVQACP